MTRTPSRGEHLAQLSASVRRARHTGGHAYIDGGGSYRERRERARKRIHGETTAYLLAKARGRWGVL